LLPAYANLEVIGVGGTVEPLWLHGRPPWFPPEFDWVVGCTYCGMPEVAGPVRNLIGCNMSFRREVFEGVGGFRSGIGRIGTYPLQTRPGGVRRGVADALRGDPSGCARTAAIVAGLAMTATGYLEGRLAHRQHPTGEIGQWAYSSLAMSLD